MLEIGRISRNKNYNLKKVNRVTKVGSIKANCSDENNSREDSRNKKDSPYEFHDVFEKSIDQQKVKKMK